MKRTELKRKQIRPVFSPLKLPSGETYGVMGNDLLMSRAALANGKPRMLHDGLVNIHVLHVLDLLLAQVRAKDDTAFGTYSITATELWRQFRVKRYPSPREIAALIRGVAGFTTIVETPRHLVSVRWCERAVYDKGEKILVFQLSEQLRPFLLDLKKNFTGLRTRDLLRMRRVYSHQLYAIVTRFEGLYRRTHQISLDELCDALLMPADHAFRRNWKHLWQKVLWPTRADVFANTGLIFDMRPVRDHGRKRGAVVAIAISGIRYAPELVRDLETEDEDAYQLRMLRLAAKQPQRLLRFAPQMPQEGDEETDRHGRARSIFRDGRWQSVHYEDE
jgi:hypothetical protein